MARVHLFGASGSGTTTLGRAVAGCLNAPLLDTDDYYWLWDGVPFTQKRPPEERLRMLSADMAGGNWVNAGSLCGWGDPLVPRFTLAAFVYTPWPIRRARLEARERVRFGDRICPGGDMYEQHLAFMDWASRYDTGGPDMRSLVEHESWISRLPCKTIRLDGSLSIAEMTEIVLRASDREV